MHGCSCNWILDTGFWIQDSGYWLLVIGYMLLVICHSSLVTCHSSLFTVLCTLYSVLCHPGVPILPAASFFVRKRTATPMEWGCSQAFQHLYMIFTIKPIKILNSKIGSTRLLINRGKTLPGGLFSLVPAYRRTGAIRLPGCSPSGETGSSRNGNRMDLVCGYMYSGH